MSFFSSRRRHTSFECDWSSDVCSSDLPRAPTPASHSAALVRLFRPGRASPPGWLLLHHAHPDLGPDVGVDLDPDLEVAQLADRLGGVHLALVHVDPELLRLAPDVAPRYR